MRVSTYKHNSKLRNSRELFTMSLPKSSQLFIVLLCIQLTILCFTHQNVSETESGALSASSMCQQLLETKENIRTQASTINTIKKDDDDDASTAGIILHVGPHKTGTTSLQKQMRNHSKDLEIDGFSVVPVIPGLQPVFKSLANIAIDLQGFKGYANTTSYQVFHSFLRDTFHNGSIALLSSEEFSKELVPIPTLVDMLLSERENHPFSTNKVQIIVTYRRLFEWLLSLYSELHRFPDKFIHINGPEGKGFPSFVEWLRRNMLKNGGGKHIFGWKHELQPSAVASRWRKYFDHIHILNFHEDRYGLEVNFFCNVLRQHHRHHRHTHQQDSLQSHYRTQTKACDEFRHQAARTVKMENTKMNKRKPSQYPMIAYRAKVNGLIVNNQTISVDAAAQHIQHYYENTTKRSIHDLPQLCLQQELVDLLWESSLLEEQEMVPDWYFRNDPEGAGRNSSSNSHMDGEQDLKAKFDSFVKSSHLCDVDVAKTLEDSKLRKFLKTL